jgi:NADPH:quinone reductase-like Zn-dependent oxidoreductase
MKAWVLREKTLNIEEVERPTVGHGEVLIKLKYAALNHRDEWIRKGQYAKIQYPSILGSDGMGEVTEIGEGVDGNWRQKDIIINPNINWGNDPEAQSKEYKILGMPDQGTLAQYIKVNEDRLSLKPRHLSEEGAAALPLAGLTAYNALFNKGKIKENMNVLINGVGGGVAQFAFQFALAVGANVWVSSSKEEVLESCVSMGAKGRINYHRPDAYDIIKKESQGFDLIIDSAGGDQMNTLISVLKPKGKLVFYGATQGLPSNLNLRAIFWNHISIIGSTMGSDVDFKNMIAFVEKHKINPIVDKVFEWNDVEHAFDRLSAGFQFGKIVIKITE